MCELGRYNDKPTRYMKSKEDAHVMHAKLGFLMPAGAQNTDSRSRDSANRA
jgi:hypothetical protein